MKFKYHKQYRLPEFDYSSNNGYFITIVTKDRQHFFGEIINKEMFITEIGLFVEDNFRKIEKEILHLKIHEYVIMPNDIHFIAVTYGFGFRESVRELSSKNVVGVADNPMEIEGLLK